MKLVGETTIINPSKMYQGGVSPEKINRVAPDTIQFSAVSQSWKPETRNLKPETPIVPPPNSKSSNIFLPHFQTISFHVPTIGISPRTPRLGSRVKGRILKLKLESNIFVHTLHPISFRSETFLPASMAVATCTSPSLVTTPHLWCVL